eukprot:4090087-Prymnesium_polylepis.1
MKSELESSEMSIASSMSAGHGVRTRFMMKHMRTSAPTRNSVISRSSTAVMPSTPGGRSTALSLASVARARAATVPEGSSTMAPANDAQISIII